MVDEKIKKELLNTTFRIPFFQIYSKNGLVLEELLEDKELKEKWDYLNEHLFLFEDGDFFRELSDAIKD